jgi:hypothetical protein
MAGERDHHATRRVGRPLAIGVILGIAAAAAWMGLCFWLSRMQLEQISPVALARTFDPWWRWWPVAICFFITCWGAGSVAELRGAFVVLQARESARLPMKTSAAKSSL